MSTVDTYGVCKVITTSVKTRVRCAQAYVCEGHGSRP